MLALPPPAPEELPALEVELELLKQALLLCDQLPCLGGPAAPAAEGGSGSAAAAAAAAADLGAQPSEPAADGCPAVMAPPQHEPWQKEAAAVAQPEAEMQQAAPAEAAANPAALHVEGVQGERVLQVLGPTQELDDETGERRLSGGWHSAAVLAVARIPVKQTATHCGRGQHTLLPASLAAKSGLPPVKIAAGRADCRRCRCCTLQVGSGASATLGAACRQPAAPRLPSRLRQGLAGWGSRSRRSSQLALHRRLLLVAAAAPCRSVWPREPTAAATMTTLSSSRRRGGSSARSSSGVRSGPARRPCGAARRWRCCGRWGARRAPSWCLSTARWWQSTRQRCVDLRGLCAGWHSTGLAVAKDGWQLKAGLPALACPFSTDRLPACLPLGV